MMQMQSRRKEEALEVSGIAPEVRQVLVAISHAISLERMELPDEFYPSHLPVALIDAVYRARLGDGAPATSSAERYCHQFGLRPCGQGAGNRPPSTNRRPWEI